MFVPNGTVSESTVAHTELREFFWSHRLPGRELSEFLSVHYLCAQANSPSFSQNSPSLPQNSVSSLFPNCALDQRRRDDKKNKFCVFEGGGLGGREENRPKTLFFFVGNATTIKFWMCEFDCREILVSLRRLLLETVFRPFPNTLEKYHELLFVLGEAFWLAVGAFFAYSWAFSLQSFVAY